MERKRGETENDVIMDRQGSENSDFMTMHAHTDLYPKRAKNDLFQRRLDDKGR